MSISDLPRIAAGHMGGATGLPATLFDRTGARMRRAEESGPSAQLRWRWVAERTLRFAGPVLAVCFLVRAILGHDLAFDFMHSYLHGARDVVAGRSPYHYADIKPGIAFLYPPLTAYVVSPFLLLPRLVTEIIVSLLGAAACLGALWASGVRDRLCYLLAFGSPIMFFSIQTGNLSAVVTLGAALVWRYRDKKLTPVGAGLLVALKLYAWPILLFYIATRRARAAFVGGVSALAAILLPWAALGFAGFASYPGMLSARTHIQEGTSYTVGALVAHFAPWTVAHGVTYLLAGLVVIWIARGRSEAQVFCATLGLTVLLSPLTLYDYFGLIFVVLGIMNRARNWLWSAPLVLWLAPAVGGPSLYQLVLVLVVVGLIIVGAIRAPEPATRPTANDDDSIRPLSRRTEPLIQGGAPAIGSTG